MPFILAGEDFRVGIAGVHKYYKGNINIWWNDIFDGYFTTSTSSCSQGRYMPILHWNGIVQLISRLKISIIDSFFTNLHFSLILTLFLYETMVLPSR
jgi:hypothetical protein